MCDAKNKCNECQLVEFTLRFSLSKQFDLKYLLLQREIIGSTELNCKKAKIKKQDILKILDQHLLSSTTCSLHEIIRINDRSQ